MFISLIPHLLIAHRHALANATQRKHDNRTHSRTHVKFGKSSCSLHRRTHGQTDQFWDSLSLYYYFTPFVVPHRTHVRSVRSLMRKCARSDRPAYAQGLLRFDPTTTATTTKARVFVFLHFTLCPKSSKLLDSRLQLTAPYSPIHTHTDTIQVTGARCTKPKNHENPATCNNSRKRERRTSNERES